MNTVHHGWFSDDKEWIGFIIATVVLWLLAMTHASVRPILGAGRGIYRSIPSLGISPRIRSASVYLVNLWRLRRLASAWWKACARSHPRTKSRSLCRSALGSKTGFAAKPVRC